MKKVFAVLLACMLACGSIAAASAAETDNAAAAAVEETPVAAPDETVPDEIAPDETTPDGTTPEEPAPDETAERLMGDADGNGTVDINDATLVQRFAAEIAAEDAPDLVAADVNRDGLVNITDATILQRYIAEFIPDFNEWAPQKELTLSETALSLRVGDTAQLTASYTQADGAVRFASNQPEVVTVDAQGTVAAVGVGEAVITATADNGMTASCTVTVKKKLVPLTLNHTALRLGTGDRVTLTASADSSEGVTFTSADKSVADVTEQGEISANSIGTTVITAADGDGQTAQCAVTVVKGVSKVTLSRYTYACDIGGSFSLVAYIGDGEYTCGGAFSTDNAAVAAVSPYGDVTAVSYGTAHIAYTTAGGVSAVCTVNVFPAPDSVSVSPVNLILGKGEAYALRALYDGGKEAFGARYACSNTSVAAVNPDTGVITAKSVGYATVTVTSVNGHTAKCYLTVKAAPARVTFFNSSVNMLVGEKTPFFLRNAADDAVVNSAAYVSSNPDVVEITADGAAVAKQTGTATITATSYNGKSATVTVTVLANAGSNVKTTTAAVGMLTDTSWGASRVVILQKGVSVTVFDTSANGRWVKVKYGNSCGWIYNKAIGVSKNYSSVTNSTLPAVADDKIFDLNVSKRRIYDFVYNEIGYVNTDNDTTENLCVYAFKRYSGSCYHHAALIEYLYNRCGWETVRIVGIDWLTGGDDHSWCIVKTADGWRHVDAQSIIGFSNSNQYFVKDSLLSDYFSWDRSIYPAAV